MLCLHFNSMNNKFWFHLLRTQKNIFEIDFLTFSFKLKEKFTWKCYPLNRLWDLNFNNYLSKISFVFILCLFMFISHETVEHILLLFKIQRTCSKKKFFLWIAFFLFDFFRHLLQWNHLKSNEKNGVEFWINIKLNAFIKLSKGEDLSDPLINTFERLKILNAFILQR
jgi:hypothetical protein